DVLTKEFRSGESNALSVVAPAGGGDAAITAYAESLSRVPQVARGDALTGSFVAGARVAPATQANQRFANPTGTWMSVAPVSSLQPQSPAGERLVHAVRAVPSPWPVL